MTATASAGIRKSMVPSSCGEALDDDGGPLAPADAGAAQSIAAGLPPEGVEQVEGEPRAARPERMAQGHGAAVNVGPLSVETKLLLHGQVLGGKRLVDLHQVHLVE